MLELRSVSKTYPNGTQALADVSLTVASAEILVIVGGSGCGKSTLLRLVAGLDRPTGGEVKVDGSPMLAPHPAVGLVFQDAKELEPLRLFAKEVIAK